MTNPSQSSGVGSGTVGTVPLFTPILHPIIRSISHESLVKWTLARREYEAKPAARCRVTGEIYDAVAESVTDSFEPELLDVFCELKLGKSPTDVTDETLMAAIKQITSTVKNNTLPDIKALFKKELKMNMGESDVDARVIDYFKSFNKIAMNNGLTECFAGNDGVREKCKRLMASLHPVSLKNEVKQCVRFQNKVATSDPKLLFELIIERAKEHERQFQRLKLQKQKSATQEQVTNPDPPLKRKKKTWDNKKPAPNPTSTAVVNTTMKSKPLVDPTSKVPKTSSNPPPGRCPKCKELHWLRECTKATEAEKAELVKRIREAKKTKKARLTRLGELLPNNDRKVTLNGVLTLPYCPDTGSDYTVIGRSHWKKLQIADPTVVAERLEVPVRNQTFGSTWVKADSKTNLKILIHTAVGPVEPMELVSVLIVDVDDDEFIVGNDLLTVLGIDVERQLEQLAIRKEDETSGDSIELEADNMPVNLPASVSSDDDIFAAVERLIDRAVENGFPLERVEQLRTIVHAYDVWRLELRSDPPANVPPLEIRLQDGARPTK